MKSKAVVIACLLALCSVVAVGEGFGSAPSRSLLRYDRPIGVLIGRKSLDRKLVRLKLEKSKFVLTVLYGGRPLKSYPVVLGADPVHNKLCEGDGCTPEGDFKIVQIRSPHKWSRFLLLSYPTAASRTRFLAARRAGRLTARAAIGGMIGIHGVPRGYDSAIDAHQNWTAGCIALKTRDIIEIAGVCTRGTPVKIVH